MQLALVPGATHSFKGFLSHTLQWAGRLPCQHRFCSAWESFIVAITYLVWVDLFRVTNTTDQFEERARWFLGHGSMKVTEMLLFARVIVKDTLKLVIHDKAMRMQKWSRRKIKGRKLCWYKRMNELGLWEQWIIYNLYYDNTINLLCTYNVL